MAVISGSTKLTRKGQITIPQAVREALGLKEGDALVVEVEEVDGHKRATVKSALAIIDELFGSAKPAVLREESLDADESDTHAAWARAAVERDIRSQQR